MTTYADRDLSRSRRPNGWKQYSKWRDQRTNADKKNRKWIGLAAIAIKSGHGTFLFQTLSTTTFSFYHLFHFVCFTTTIYMQSMCFFDFPFGKWSLIRCNRCLFFGKREIMVNFTAYPFAFPKIIKSLCWPSKFQLRRGRGGKTISKNVAF